jgi:sugar transferase (PEP-CTERM/EpsH1 system associated)
LLKQLNPAIVHTRNLATIEYQLPAFFAGVKHRIHGEHGWDVFDPEGSNKKYQWLRRLLKPLIHRYIPLSKQLESYLVDSIRVNPKKITRIINGVDTAVFYPYLNAKSPLIGCPFTVHPGDIVIGSVGRMHGVKDQLTLVKAFIRVCRREAALKPRLKLMLIGEGPLREQAIRLLEENQLMAQSWLPGERHDIADIMRQLDLFILPSQAEGISNTILEAMATGLPVIATAVGGNPELVTEGITGQLTPANDEAAMADHILGYAQDQEKMREHGHNARQRALLAFSQAAMVARYQTVYDSLLTQE